MLSTLEYMIVLIIHIIGIYIILKKDYFFKIPIYSFYFICITVFNALGSFYIFFRGNYNYGFRDVYTDNYFYLLIFQCISYYFFLLFHSNKSIFILNNIRPKVIITTKFFYVMWIYTLTFFFLYIFQYGLPPLFNINEIIGKSINVYNVRTNYTVNVENFHWYYVAFFIFPQLATIFYFVQYKNKYKKYKLTTLILSVLCTLLFSLLFLNKTPTVLFIINFSIVIFLRNKKIYSKQIIKLLCIIIIAIYALYYIYFPYKELSYYTNILFISIIRRIFGAYTSNLAAAFKIVSQNNFFYGKTFSNPGGILPYIPVNLPNLIHIYLNGVPGNATVPAIGEAYVNFGWIGVCLYVLLINYIILGFQRVINRLYQLNEAFGTIILIYFLILVYKITITSIMQAFLSPVYIINLLLLFILLLVFKQRGTKYGFKQGNKIN